MFEGRGITLRGAEGQLRGAEGQAGGDSTQATPWRCAAPIVNFFWQGHREMPGSSNSIAYCMLIVCTDMLYAYLDNASYSSGSTSSAQLTVLPALSWEPVQLLL
jgi:hypothetical protein